MVKYRRPAWARPPPGAAGCGGGGGVGDELEHAAAQGVAPLGPAGELDLALGLEFEETLVEGDHRVEVGGDETHLDAR